MNLFVSAGEASGDLHGSFLVRAIKARSPDARITCLGGPLLREAVNLKRHFIERL